MLPLHYEAEWCKTLGCPFVYLAIDFSSNLPDFTFFCRRCRIWTCDLLVPNQARYRATLISVFSWNHRESNSGPSGCKPDALPNWAMTPNETIPNILQFGCNITTNSELFPTLPFFPRYNYTSQMFYIPLQSRIPKLHKWSCYSMNWEHPRKLFCYQ